MATKDLKKSLNRLPINVSICSERTKILCPAQEQPAELPSNSSGELTLY